MAITRTAMVDDDGSGTTGTIINNAWKTELYNQIDGATAGGNPWQFAPFNAGDFSGNGGGWAVSTCGEFVYTVTGKSMIVQVGSAIGTVTGGTTTALFIKLPFGSALGATIGVALVQTTAGYLLCFCASQSGNMYIQRQDATSAFAAGALTVVAATLNVRLA